MIRLIAAGALLFSTAAFAGQPAHSPAHGAHDHAAHGGEHGPAHAQDHAHDHDHAGHGKIEKPTEEELAAIDAKLAEAVAAGGELIVADVLGVVCDFCALAMNKTFDKRKEVAVTRVDLDTKTLTLVTKPGETMNDKTIRDLVTRSGYKLAAIHRGEDAVKKLTAKDENAPA